MARKNRRQFLQHTDGGTASVAALGSTAAAAPAASAQSQTRIAGANRRVRVALIGCGGMGNGDLRDMLRAGAQLVALCDVDDDQTAKTRASVEKNFNQKPELVTRDFRRVLDRQDIDAVIVGTPDHWHALPTMLACQAGKDVYVEKPLALTIGEGRVMVDAARRHKRVVQMGTQQRSATHFARGGRLREERQARQDPPGEDVGVPGLDGQHPGRARQRPAADRRLRHVARAGAEAALQQEPLPLQLPLVLRLLRRPDDRLGRPHDRHRELGRWASRRRAPAASVGGKFGFPDDAEETPDTQQALWEFDGFSMIWEHATAVGQGPYMRDHGVAFHGNNGVLVVDRGGWEVLPETETKSGRKTYRMAGEPRRAVGGQDYHLMHVQNFLDCMDSRQAPALRRRDRAQLDDCLPPRQHRVPRRPPRGVGTSTKSRSSTTPTRRSSSPSRIAPPGRSPPRSDVRLQQGVFMFRAARFAGLLVAAALVMPLHADHQAQSQPTATPASPSTAGSRVFEMRTYFTHPGKLEDLNKRFRDHTTRLFKKHGMENVGYWIPNDKPDVLVYILAHTSREAADASWKAFQSDPEWQKARTESEAAGPIVAKVERVWMAATDYSAIR